MIYLITYDITDNKKRYKVAELLKDRGGIRLQKSVFVIHLSQKGLTSLRQALTQTWAIEHHPPDQLLIIRIHKTAFYKMTMIGEQINPALVLGMESTLII